MIIHSVTRHRAMKPKKTLIWDQNRGDAFVHLVKLLCVIIFFNVDIILGNKPLVDVEISFRAETVFIALQKRATPETTTIKTRKLNNIKKLINNQ